MHKPSALRLKPLGHGTSSAILDIPAGGLTLGRDPQNDVSLEGDEHPFVSAFHARLSWDGESCVVEDLDSKNGTLVNGRTIERQALSPGDVVQLGREVGARFAVVGDTSTTQTLNIADELDAESGSDLGATTIIRMKAVLGIPEGGVPVRRHRWAPSPTTVIVLVILIGVVVGALVYQNRINQDQAIFLAEDRRTIETFRASQAQLADDYDADHERLAGARDRLQAQIDNLTASDASSADEIDGLQARLLETNQKLEQYKPIDLKEVERSKREILERVLSAIVYIEKRVVLQEKDSDRFLHMTSAGVFGLKPRTPEREDELVVDDVASGSGFCISSAGHIATNAHVIENANAEEILDFRGSKLHRTAMLVVVFTGTKERHAAHLLKSQHDATRDVAILKIDSFENMPVIVDFTTDVEIPPQGAPLRLFGFPLGTQLIQDSDLMTASVFQGSVSRDQGAGVYIQVQSSVYPGNSGGPVVDESGRVIGIVTGVQTVAGGQIASDIGFVLPIRSLSTLWPLRD